ncbi:MAG: hypothetical protein EOP60_10115 [Sphingomonadales bacterium]|nr:MAG: hypothetical protein EOP60_10115 [Sphingomonadales bacterium]
MDPVGPLNQPQSVRSTLNASEKLRLETEISVTPLGVFAIGALVCGILLSVPPIIRAGARAAEARKALEKPGG